MKKILSIISIAFLTIFISPSTANAGISVGQMVGSGIIEPPQAPSLEPRTGPIGRDGSYGIVDSNGSVTNIVVCGVYCANGTFGPGGDTAVLQIPNSNSGIWFGPGTTMYDKESNTFTAINPTSEEIETTIGDSSTKIFGKRTLTFVSGNVFIDSGGMPQGVIDGWTEDSLANVSVTSNNIKESLDLGNKKTNQQVRNLIQDSNLLLLNDRVQVLIDLLGSWVK
jgi:hypothetical protein